jgi:hypothetical protein
MRGLTMGILIGIFALLSMFLLFGWFDLGVREHPETAVPTSRTSSSSTGLHELTFIQENTSTPLGPVGWLAWSVTLSNGAVGNLTESNPSNTEIVQCPSHGISVFTNQTVSTITFLEPYGSYHYEADTAQGSVSGQIDFSPSNAVPVEINPAPACGLAP